MAAKTEKSSLNQGFFARKLRQLDAWFAKKFQRLDEVVWYGGSKGLTRKRTGNKIKDFFSSIWYNSWQKLDKLDTLFYFSDRPYQAKACRVKSKAEKKIANWLTDHDITFVYEKRLHLGSQTVKPDFYLVDQQVYIEFWGLALANPQYKAKHEAKLALYQQHHIPLISLYPHHLDRLDQIIPHLFQQVANRQLL